MIKAVIFDCFGVLTTDTWKAFLDTIPDQSIVQRLTELNRQLDSGFLEMSEFLQQVFEITGRKLVEVEKLLNNEIVKNQQLLSYISALRVRGIKIGLLSNVSTNWIRDTFLNNKEQQLFDAMVFSHEVHMTKPQPEIFELTCARLDVQPAEAIMVDDVLGNCDAAKSIGMRAIVYKDFQLTKSAIEARLIS